MSSPRVSWILAAFVLVGATQGAVEFVRTRNEPRTVRPLRKELTELDKSLPENWGIDKHASPEASGIDPRVLEELGTQQAVTRQYVNDEGLRCSVHAAVWMDPNEWTPHPPELCYAGAGFTPRARIPTTLPGTSGHPIRIVHFVSSNTGREAHTVYWYQLGDSTYYDRDTARPIRRSLWGNLERPPLIKVLMQFDNAESDSSKEQVLELAASIQDFLAGI